MSDKTEVDVSYEPPTKEFIRNSLLYGLTSENQGESGYAYSQSITDGYSNLGTILKNKSRIERSLIQFAFAHKKRIKSIPVLGKFALSVKRYLVRKSLSGAAPGFARLDLSGIMGLEVNDFIWQIYILAFGRAPDEEGWKKHKYLLCSGATREAVAYMICTSTEFANRAQVAFIDQYRKAFWQYRIREAFRRLPVIEWIYAIAAVPRRIYRLEVEERMRHADAQLLDRQRFEAVMAIAQDLQNRFDSHNSTDASGRVDHNRLHLQNKALQMQVENLKCRNQGRV